MSHFAQIDENDRVVRVIVAEQQYIDSGRLGDPNSWIQTSYNTQAGVHTKGGTPLRKNYAGPDMIYDRSRDAFRLPQPYPSWRLDEATCLWQPPVPYPGGFVQWDEPSQSWIPDPNAPGEPE